MASGSKTISDPKPMSTPGSGITAGSPTVRALDKKAKSYLKVFQRSLSSSALDRNKLVADEDMSAMTIDFLSTRLQAQRAHYKAEKQRARALVQKILELEHRLSIEVELRKQAERGIIAASTSPNYECIGPDHTPLGRVGYKGSHSSSSSSTEEFYGHVNDVDIDGDERGVFEGHPFPRGGDHGGGSGHLKIDGKSSLHSSSLLPHIHPNTCLGKEMCPEAVPADLRRTRQIQGCVGEQGSCLPVGSVQHGMDKGCLEEHKEQDEVDPSLHACEHRNTVTSFECQACDLPKETRKLSTIEPVMNLQQLAEYTTDMRMISEIVEDSAPDCVQKGCQQVQLPYPVVEDTCRHLCPYDDDARVLIRFPCLASDKSKLPCQEGELDIALGRQQRYSNPAMKISELSNGAPRLYKVECKNTDSRQVTASKGSTPKRRELGHSLSMGRVVVPSEYSTLMELKPVEQNPEPLYSMTEVLRMLECTKHICASNRIPGVKVLDEDGKLNKSHCPRPRQVFRRSQSSRFLTETSKTGGL